MRLVRLFVACLVVLVLGVLGVSSASAKGTALYLRSPNQGNRLLEPGDYIEGESSGGTTVESPGVDVDCGGGTFVGLYGKVLTNGAKTDRLTITGGKRSFEGGSCTGSFPVGGEIRNYWVGGSELGSMTLSEKTTALFKSSHSTAAKYRLESGETGHFCTYGVKKLKGIVAHNVGEPVGVMFTKQPLKLVEHDIETCPKTVTISVAMALKTAIKGSPEAEEHFAFSVVEGTVS
jgi:hypothetical protein